MGSGPAPHTDPACLVTQKKTGGAPGAPRESSKTRLWEPTRRATQRDGRSGKAGMGWGLHHGKLGEDFVAEGIGPRRREQEELMQKWAHRGRGVESHPPAPEPGAVPPKHLVGSSWS